MDNWKKLIAFSSLLAYPLLIIFFVLWAHVYSGKNVFVPAANAKSDPEWAKFSDTYNVEERGIDGYYVRAVRNGYNLVHRTYDAGWRFTRKTWRNEISSCIDCHSDEQLAYAFVNSDRYNPQFGKRVSFEESIMRCYAKHLDGFVPTIFDPAIRDIRIYARLIAHHLKLTEGQMIDNDPPKISFMEKNL